MKTLETLFLDELADMYDAEHHLTHALPRMARVTTSEDLRDAFKAHLSETEGHVDKIEKIFAAFGKPVRAKSGAAMRGLLVEGEEIISDNKYSPTLNAALVSTAQKLEHYEIASYGTLREWAEQLGNLPAVELLEEILDEEKATDQKLTDLARDGCNPAAQAERGKTTEGDAHA